MGKKGRHNIRKQKKQRQPVVDKALENKEKGGKSK